MSALPDDRGAAPVRDGARVEPPPTGSLFDALPGEFAPGGEHVHLARPGWWPVCGARVEDKRLRSGCHQDVTCPECLRRRREL